jgi:hypothetical protein
MEASNRVTSSKNPDWFLSINYILAPRKYHATVVGWHDVQQVTYNFVVLCVFGFRDCYMQVVDATLVCGYFTYSVGPAWHYCKLLYIA